MYSATQVASQISQAQTESFMTTLPMQLEVSPLAQDADIGPPISQTEWQLEFAPQGASLNSRHLSSGPHESEQQELAVEAGPQLAPVFTHCEFVLSESWQCGVGV